MRTLNKIITAEQTRKADEYTISNEPIRSIDLMERASAALCNEIDGLINTEDKILVVCGCGNNGGDGLAIARILFNRGYDISIFIASDAQKSQDCSTNFDRLPKDIFIYHTDNHVPFSDYEVTIDAIFGSGLTRPVEGELQAVIDKINESESFVISIDVPSGLFCDSFNNVGAKVKADLVVSFQRPKRVFFFPESANFIGHWVTVDIGLDEKFIQGLDSRTFILGDQLETLIKPRLRVSNKGNYGHALIIAGSKGKMGAAVLSTKACLRSGAGLVTALVPACGYDVMQISAPEAMCLSCDNADEIDTLYDISKYSAVAIGPGVGVMEKTVRVMESLLSQVAVPLVIDADAINIISAHAHLKNQIPANSILTPHPREFERLVGAFTSTEERIKLQLAFSAEYSCIVVLKDANTSISDASGNLYFNITGNPGMATGGSGDVLTGMITALLAQGYSPLEAAMLGTYYHGIAGDEASEVKGEVAMLAGDIINFIRFGG